MPSFLRKAKSSSSSRGVVVEQPTRRGSAGGLPSSSTNPFDGDNVDGYGDGDDDDDIDEITDPSLLDSDRRAATAATLAGEVSDLTLDAPAGIEASANAGRIQPLAPSARDGQH